MNIYQISQSESRGYDTYSSAIVCAENEEEARNINPAEDWKSSTWCERPSQVRVELLGQAISGLGKGIICSSFHAG